MLKKAILFPAGIVGLLILIFVFLLIWNFDSPGIGQKLMDQTMEATGLQLTAERVRFNVFRGLRLDGVQARGNIIGGGHVEMNLEKIICLHRVVSLFRGKVEIEEIILGKTQVDVVLMRREKKAPPALPSFGPAITGSGVQKTKRIEEDRDEEQLRFDIGNIHLEDGNITIRDERKQITDKTVLRLSGLQFSLQNLSYAPAGAITPLHALSAEGTVRAREATSTSRRIENVTSRMRLYNGRIELEDLDLKTDKGVFAGKMLINLNANVPVYELTLDADPFDLRATVGTDNGFGPASLHISGKGIGFDGRYLAARGLLKLKDGKFPNHKAIVQIEDFLGWKGLKDSTYRSTEIPFSIEQGQVSIKEASVESEHAMLSLSGSVKSEGSMALDVSLRMLRKDIANPNIPKQKLDGMKNDQGWITLPLKVVGTMNDPELVLDMTEIN